MGAASSPRANPVTPSLCWGSSWPPRWTVSAHVLAASAVCAAPQQPWHTLPLTQACDLSRRRPVSAPASLCPLLYPPCFCDCLLCPAAMHHTLHHHSSNSAQPHVCVLQWDSHLPWNPHLCCHHLFCGVRPWPQPDARRCRMPQAALSPRKGGMMEW